MANILHICAKNDNDGNPRRLFVMSNEEGKFIAAWDEGYKGSDAVPGDFRKDAYLSQRLDVPVAQYNKLRRTLPSPAYAYQVEGYSHLR
jgi:hypothetical protein